MTNDVATIIIASISALAAISALIYGIKNYLAMVSPRIVIESPFNSSLEIRNIGTGLAINIKETSGLLNGVPEELWNSTGPLDYQRVKNPPTIAKAVNFRGDKKPEPSASVIIRLEYENTNGNKFYSEIKVTRGYQTDQAYFSTPNLIRWKRKRAIF